MGRIATVKIRNKHNGKIRTVNQDEWALDLGKGRYNGWERLGGERMGDGDTAIDVDTEAEKAKAAKAAKDAKDAEEAAAKEREAADAAAAEETEETVEAEETEETVEEGSKSTTRSDGQTGRSSAPRRRR